MKLAMPANTILDEIFDSAQASLTNYTRVKIPSFKYSNPLASIAVKRSYFQGLHSFHRVGEVTVDVHPLGKNQLKFGVGWAEVVGVFNIELYLFQFGMNLVPDSGTLTIKMSNVSSVQAVSVDPLKFTFEIDELDLSLGEALVEFEGFSPTARIGGKMLTAFINENKDTFLGVVSLVLKTLINACVIGMRTVVLPF